MHIHDPTHDDYRWNTATSAHRFSRAVGVVPDYPYSIRSRGNWTRRTVSWRPGPLELEWMKSESLLCFSMWLKSRNDDGDSG